MGSLSVQLSQYKFYWQKLSTMESISILHHSKTNTTLLTIKLIKKTKILTNSHNKNSESLLFLVFTPHDDFYSYGNKSISTPWHCDVSFPSGEFLK